MMTMYRMRSEVSRQSKLSRSLQKQGQLWKALQSYRWRYEKFMVKRTVEYRYTKTSRDARGLLGKDYNLNEVQVEAYVKSKLF